MTGKHLLSSGAAAPVTIVIPVYNRPEQIVRCLDSVLAQTFRPLNVIVVDNNSTDSTPQAIRNWQQSRLTSCDGTDFTFTLLSQPVPGAAAARQLGLEHSPSPYTLFFDSDDLMHPDQVQTALGETDGADLLLWRLRYVDSEKGRELRTSPFVRSRFIWRHIFNSTFPTLAYMARTELFRRAGGWNPELRVWDDWELGLRLLLLQPRIKSIPNVLATVNCQADSITGSGFTPKAPQWENVARTMVRVLREHSRHIPGRTADTLNIWLLAVMARLAGIYIRENNAPHGRNLLEKTLALLPPGTKHPRFERLRLRLVAYLTSKGIRGAHYLYFFHRKLPGV